MPCWVTTETTAILGAGRCAAPCVADAAPILTALNAIVLITGRSRHQARANDIFLPLVRRDGRQAGRTDPFHRRAPHAIAAHQAFEKSAGWDGDFADASAAVNLAWQGARLASASISLGAVSPLPIRATETEKALLAGDLSDAAIRAAAEKTVHGALPSVGQCT